MSRDTSQMDFGDTFALEILHVLNNIKKPLTSFTVLMNVTGLTEHLFSNCLRNANIIPLMFFSDAD